MRFAGWFGLSVGLLMLGQWAFFLLAGQVPELATAPWSIGFHLAAEAATAGGLILSGVALLRSRAWGRVAYLPALGMLIYSVIASAGYFAQSGAWPLVAMFGLLLTLALVSLWRLRLSELPVERAEQVAGERPASIRTDATY
jgi:hypothetical protein